MKRPTTRRVFFVGYLELSIGRTATGTFKFLQLGLEGERAFGFLKVQVLGFAGVGFEVVELPRGAGGLLRQGKLFHAPFTGAGIVVAAGAAVIEVLPVAMADGDGEADGLVQGVLAHGLLAAQQCG